MKTMTFITENKAGLLSEMTYILGKCKVNVEDLNMDVIGENAVIDLTVRNSQKASQILVMNGFRLIEKKLLVKLVGSKEQCTEYVNKKLNERGIKVYGIDLICHDDKKGMFSLDVDQPRRAGKILNEIADEAMKKLEQL